MPRALPLVLAVLVCAAGCASGGGGDQSADLPFVGGVVAPADLSQPLGDPAPARNLGDDGDQDALAIACHGDDFRSCDDLYQRGAPNTAYTDYGFTCGGRLNPAPTPGQAPNCRLRSIGQTGRVGGPPPTGDSATLDVLAESCGSITGLEQCDTLYREAPQGTEYASYGITCGYRIADTRPNACAGFDGVPAGRPLGVSGGDAELDAQADECFRARISSCDELYASSDRGSIYETYAQTCGGRLAEIVERVQPSCDLRFNDPVATEVVDPPRRLGQDVSLNGLVVQCAGGTMRSCDQLFDRSDLNTDYENYGATCGGRFAAQRTGLAFSAAGECEARVIDPNLPT